MKYKVNKNLEWQCKKCHSAWDWFINKCTNPKCLNYLILLFLFMLPMTYSLTGYTMLANRTGEEGNILKFTMRDRTTWEDSAAVKKSGSYAYHSTQGSTLTHGSLQIENATFLRKPTDTNLIQGWVRDPIGESGNNGGYTSISFWNTTATKLQGIGITCENTLMYLVQNNSKISGNDFYAGSGTDCGNTWFYLEVIMNATSNKIGYRIYTDNTKSSLITSNIALADLQDYQGYMGFQAGRNGYWDNVEFYKLNTGPTADTTPPTIANVRQYPINATMLNLANQKLLINATVTDDVKVKYSNLTIKINKTEIYFNKKLINSNFTIKNMSTSGSVHKWNIDETYLLGGTYPLNFTIFKNTPHSNVTMTTNNVVKMKFYNVSSSVQANLFEIYAGNTTATGTTQYFYCNSSYTTGNPTTSSMCYQFYTVNINRPFNHTHGSNSKHKIIPLGINTTNGKIGSVKVTPTSFILKRVTAGSEAVFYVPNISETSQSQYSSNIGNTYSDISGTIDAHIHQLRIGAALNYKICAADNSTNTVCTSWYGDRVENPKLPPNGVVFTSPIAQAYNTSLQIVHTESFSATGQSIVNYTYSYARENTTSFTTIATVNYPTSNYTWDISALSDSAYYIKVTIKDSLGLSTVSYSDVFRVVNPTDLNTQYLKQISENTFNINEAVNMLWIVFLYLGLLFFGFQVLRSGNFVLGMAFMVLTLGFDFFFTVKLVNEYGLPNFSDTWSGSYYVIFSVLVALWVFVKISFIISYKQDRIVKA